LQFKIVEKARTLDNKVLKEENNKEDMELWQIRKIFYSNYVIMI
jgi:hypothetical protein